MTNRYEHIKSLTMDEMSKFITAVYTSGMRQGGIPFVSENLVESYIKNNLENLLSDSRKWLEEDV